MRWPRRRCHPQETSPCNTPQSLLSEVLRFLGFRNSCEANPHAKWVARVEDQRRLGVDVSAAGNARDDPAAVDAHRALEDAADDALLPPEPAFLQLAVGEEAGELGAGAGAAR